MQFPGVWVDFVGYREGAFFYTFGIQPLCVPVTGDEPNIWDPRVCHLTVLKSYEGEEWDIAVIGTYM